MSDLVWEILVHSKANLKLMFFLSLSLQASDAWGISCMRYEIRDIRMPARVQEAMQMQVRQN